MQILQAPAKKKKRDDFLTRYEIRYARSRHDPRTHPHGTPRPRPAATDYLALLPSVTAQGAIDKIRERGELETFFYLYVVEESGVLVGVVPLRNLVIATTFTDVFGFLSFLGLATLFLHHLS